MGFLKSMNRHRSCCTFMLLLLIILWWKFFLQNFGPVFKVLIKRPVQPPTDPKICVDTHLAASSHLVLKETPKATCDNFIQNITDGRWVRNSDRSKTSELDDRYLSSSVILFNILFTFLLHNASGRHTKG